MQTLPQGNRGRKTREQKTCSAQGQGLQPARLPSLPLPDRPTVYTHVHSRTLVGFQANLTQCTLSWPPEPAETEAAGAPYASRERDPGPGPGWKGSTGESKLGFRKKRTKPLFPPWGGGPKQHPALFSPLPSHGRGRLVQPPPQPRWRLDFQPNRALD